MGSEILFANATIVEIKRWSYLVLSNNNKFSSITPAISSPLYFTHGVHIIITRCFSHTEPSPIRMQMCAGLNRWNGQINQMNPMRCILLLLSRAGSLIFPSEWIVSSVQDASFIIYYFRVPAALVKIHWNTDRKIKCVSFIQISPPVPLNIF